MQQSETGNYTVNILSYIQQLKLYIIFNRNVTVYYVIKWVEESKTNQKKLFCTHRLRDNFTLNLNIA